MHTTAHCARCGRTLTDPTSIARGVGPVCHRRIRQHAAVALARHSTPVVEKAVALIASADLRPAGMWQGQRVYRALSSDGSRLYLVDRDRCTCRAAEFGRDCYHRAAVDLLAA